MTTKAPKQESNYEIVPAGNHVARVYRFLHIGTAPEEYMGESKEMNKIMLGFELLNEKKVFKEEKGPEPLAISREFTLSMGKKSNLRKFIEDMLGIAFMDTEAYSFDVESLIGEACLLNVVHVTSKNGNEYALAKSASPLPKGMEVPKAYNPVQKLSYDNFNEELFNSLPKFIKEKIMKTKEFKELKGVDVLDF